MKHFRHGDVLLTRIDSLPEGEEIKHDGRIVLAEGEATGHAHVLTQKKMKAVKTNGVMYVALEVPTPLMHEEHKTIEIEPGIYRVDKEQEYDYFLQEIRTVAD